MVRSPRLYENFYEDFRKVFFWPGMYSQVKDYCKTCPECQLIAGRCTTPVPLIPLPVTSTSFELTGVDIIGPVNRSQTQNKFILVVCDYATRNMETFPLRGVTAKQIAGALLKFSSLVGIPRELRPRPNFMSHMFALVCKLLGIRRIRTTPYHPQTGGLVERLNQTL